MTAIATDCCLAWSLSLSSPRSPPPPFGRLGGKINDLKWKRGVGKGRGTACGEREGGRKAPLIDRPFGGKERERRRRRRRTHLIVFAPHL